MERGRLAQIISVVEEHSEEGVVNAQAIFVVNETQLLELVHERTNSRAAGPDHLRQGFLTDLRDHMLRFAVLAKVGKHQENAGEALLGGIEQLVGEVFFHSNGASKGVGHEETCKFTVLAEQSYHRLFLKPKHPR